MTDTRRHLLELTAQIVSAYVGNSKLPVTHVPELIVEVSQALRAGTGETGQPEERKPAVPIGASVKPDYIVCLEDGRKFRSIRRHLQAEHGLTPDEYRAKWGLPAHYPMVAPVYSQTRSKLAKEMGLGRKGR